VVRFIESQLSAVGGVGGVGGGGEVGQPRTSTDQSHNSENIKLIWLCNVALTSLHFLSLPLSNVIAYGICGLEWGIRIKIQQGVR